MSVKVHEAFCIDSFQDRLLFHDDFLGDSLRDLWNTVIDVGGSIAVVDQETGGVLRFTTDNDANDDCRLDWGLIRTLHIDKKVTIEYRMQLPSIANILVENSIRFDDNNFVRIDYSSAVDTNWMCACKDDAATTEIDSGVAVDVAYNIYRIECFPTGEVHFYINGTEVANSPITTNIPNDAGDYLEPRFFVRTLTTAVKIMDIDYVVIRQEI